MANKNEPDLVEIVVPDDLKKGVYSNTVNITATNNEVIINFILLNPADTPKGTVVSRVIVPTNFVKGLSEMLNKLDDQIKKQTKEK